MTHPTHRGRGLGAQMLRAAVARMREERYPVSVLWGISDFYHRFGYAPVLPGYTLTVSTRNAERLIDSVDASDVSVRSGTAADAPALTELYHRTSATRSGTLRRKADKLAPPPPRETDNWWRHPRRVMVAEAGGTPVGYALLHGDPPQQRLCQLLMGYQGIDALRREHTAACTGEDLPVIRTLFPEGSPHMWSIDHF